MTQTRFVVSLFKQGFGSRQVLAAKHVTDPAKKNPGRQKQDVDFQSLLLLCCYRMDHLGEKRRIIRRCDRAYPLGRGSALATR
jgi:hypothetical protein